LKKAIFRKSDKADRLHKIPCSVPASQKVQPIVGFASKPPFVVGTIEGKLIRFFGIHIEKDVPKKVMSRCRSCLKTTGIRTLTSEPDSEFRRIEVFCFADSELTSPFIPQKAPYVQGSSDNLRIGAYQCAAAFLLIIVARCYSDILGTRAT
jgi:hypothetical protein